MAARSRVLSIMGGADIDMSAATFSAPVTRMRVTALMGGAEVRVPEGMAVQVTKLALMGGTDVKLGDAELPTDAPILQLRLVAIMGGIKVRRGPRRRERPGLGSEDHPSELGPADASRN